MTKRSGLEGKYLILIKVKHLLISYWLLQSATEKEVTRFWKLSVKKNYTLNAWATLNSTPQKSKRSYFS